MKPIAKELTSRLRKHIVIKPFSQYAFSKLHNRHRGNFRRTLGSLNCVTHKLHAATAEESNV